MSEDNSSCKSVMFKLCLDSQCCYYNVYIR